jgi:maltooligosyltrehalose trehalohydrolase
VTEGRRKEFCHFRQFSEEGSLCDIPDPQAESTFRDSCLQWDEMSRERHRSVFRLYEALLALRRTEPAIRYAEVGSFKAYALSETTLLLRQDADLGPSLLAVIQMQGPADIDLNGHPSMDGLVATRSQLVLTTEDLPFAPDPKPPRIELNQGAPRISFARPAAVLLRIWAVTDPAGVGGTKHSDSSQSPRFDRFWQVSE